MRATKVPIKTEKFFDRQQNDIQQNAQNTAKQVNRFPFSDFQTVSATFTAGQTIDIPHRLQRIVAGAIMTSAVGGSGSWQTFPSSNTASSVRLQSQNAGTFTWMLF